MTESRKNAITALNILNYVGLEDLEILSECFLEDMNRGNINLESEFLFPYVIETKLKIYEEEY